MQILVFEFVYQLEVDPILPHKFVVGDSPIVVQSHVVIFLADSNCCSLVLQSHVPFLAVTRVLFVEGLHVEQDELLLRGGNQYLR